MSRPKRITPGGVSIKELLIRHDVDPLNELFKMYAETLPFEKGEVCDALIGSGSWEPYYNNEGKLRLRMSLSRRKELMSEAANFVYPKLRASENNTNHKESITLKIMYLDDVGKEAPAKAEIVSSTVEPLKIVDAEVS